MASKPKRSITDHFTIVPKEKKKEVKIHPLFIKKTKKENVSPPPPPSPKQEPIKKVPTVKKQAAEKRPKVKKRLDQFEPTIDTHDFFKLQKQARENKRLRSLEAFVPSPTLDIQSIKELMNQNYPRWQKNSCCKILFDTMMFRSNNKILWCDKYRPNQVDGLLGYLPDFEYLRDWLELLKIRKDTEKKDKGSLEGAQDVYNLVLLVGNHGTGKTAAAYTVAKETGYTIFEINTSSRRAGKDVIKQVGEMTASHLVRFDHQQKKRKKGETIIIRDTVKKPKTVDIATHFKRMLTMSVEKDQDVVMDEVRPASNPIDAFFKKPSQNIASTTTVSSKVTMKTSSVTTSSTVTETETIETEMINEQSDVKDEHKQSLVLLEEVDILFEEDKGFWTAVIELCQKSKRPIIMTCNGMTREKNNRSIRFTIYE